MFRSKTHKNKGFTAVSPAANRKSGFTLVEMIVAIGVFSIMIVAMMAVLLSIISASRRAEAQQTAVDNLSFALDSVSRRVRFGLNFYCTDDPVDPLDLPTGTKNCSDGASTLVFTNVIGESGRAAVRFVETDNVGRLEAVLPGSADWVPLTADSIDVTDAQFIVEGAESGDAGTGDGEQPRVRFLLDAVPVYELSEELPRIAVQTVMTQRLIDADTYTTASGGSGGSGEEGGGDEPPGEPEPNIAIGNPIHQKVSAYQSSVAIKSDGTLWTWGDNSYGQLGHGDTTDRSSPERVQLGSFTNWESVSAGRYHMVAIRQNGSIWTWGRGSSGRLGHDDTLDQTEPKQVIISGLWRMASAGEHHTMALKRDGTLWGWGYNGFGQLGIGNEISQDSPVQVGSDTDWAYVQAGSAHTLALKSDGTLWAWGWNSSGQLGTGGPSDEDVPTQIGTRSDWAAISAGGAASWAIREDGTLWAWGNNSQGQLGIDASGSRNSPTQVGTSTKWVMVEGGGAHVLGMQSNRTLWTWGSNSDGQLGVTGSSRSFKPVQVDTDMDWSNITGGLSHSMAVKTDGSLWSWGRNDDGRLGLGDTTNRGTPTQVPGFTAMIAVLPERQRIYV